MATKINTRSPFFIKATPSSGTITSITLNLYVYKGVFTTNKPQLAQVQYIIQKTPLTGNNFIVFEVSELIRDFIDIEFDGRYESTSSPEIDPVRWVEADIVFEKGTDVSGVTTGPTTTNKLIDSARTFSSTVSVGDLVLNTTDSTRATVTAVDSNTELTLDADIMASGEFYTIREQSRLDYIAFDGYGYFEDGVNPRSTDSLSLMQSNNTIFRLNDFNTRIPVYTDDTTSVSFLYKGEVKRTQSISSSTDTNAQIDYVTVSGSDNNDSYKERVLGDGGTFEDNSLLDDFLNAVDDGLVDELYVASSSGTEVVKIKTFDCSKYEPIKITFVNKFGALQDLYFSLKSTESTSVQSEQYKRSIFSETDLSYKTYQHQKQLFQTNGSDSITLNTDYLDDEHNKVIEELMLSEQTWMTRITDTSEQVTPVVPKTKSVTYKTSLNDKLSQYTIEFDMAFNKINDIR